jgi:hypothetical protein
VVVAAVAVGGGGNSSSMVGGVGGNSSSMVGGGGGGGSSSSSSSSSCSCSCICLWDHQFFIPFVIINSIYNIIILMFNFNSCIHIQLYTPVYSSTFVTDTYLMSDAS